MHVVFVHQNFPAQFGHIAAYLIQQRGFRCSFVSRQPAGQVAGIQKIQYQLQGGATASTHYCSRSFENATWHAAGVYEALKPLRHILQPDLVIGHSGFGSTLYLAELFPSTPIINYFEYFYHERNSDLDFRPEWPVDDYDRLRCRSRNAMIMLDLEYCQAGYTPTNFQKQLFPAAYAPKLRVLHDGIDTSVWRRRPPAVESTTHLELAPGTRVVTYVSRGFESMRGFDIFMRAAKKIYQAHPSVVFLVVGNDQVCYGGDRKHIQEPTFLAHVLKQDDYDLSRFRFLGQLSSATLVQLLSLSDLHIYLTVPFVLSWSLLDAMACGCTVLASDTAPVSEVIQHGENGLLCNFFDVDGLAAMAVQVLQDPLAFRPLGAAAARHIEQHYSLRVMLPRLVSFYEEVACAAPSALS